MAVLMKYSGSRYRAVLLLQSSTVNSVTGIERIYVVCQTENAAISNERKWRRLWLCSKDVKHSWQTHDLALGSIHSRVIGSTSCRRFGGDWQAIDPYRLGQLLAGIDEFSGYMPMGCMLYTVMLFSKIQYNIHVHKIRHL